MIQAHKSYTRQGVACSIFGYVAAGTYITTRMLKKSAACILITLAGLITTSATRAVNAEYSSPYSLDFEQSREELMAPDSEPPRNDWRLESRVPYEEWYTGRTRKQWGAWGPAPRHYPPVRGLESRSVAWKRARVLAVAAKYIGLPYQHHHIPDWEPPPDWPWKQVAYGRNSKGVDCSDFTSWIYNYGLGIKLSTGVVQQANATEIAGPGGDGSLQLETIRDTNGFDDLVRKLKTGDLLYIKNNGGKLAHVIMWVGSHGKSPDNAPLIIDCTGPEHKDCNGNTIPIGVQLRPFLPNTWYYKSFSHAHRIIQEVR